MPLQATPGDVPRRYGLDLQARGHRFETCCAHHVFAGGWLVEEPDQRADAPQEPAVVVLVVARCCLNALTVGSLHVSPTSEWRLLHVARGRSCGLCAMVSPCGRLGLGL